MARRDRDAGRLVMGGSRYSVLKRKGMVQRDGLAQFTPMTFSPRTKSSPYPLTLRLETSHAPVQASI